MNRASGLAVRLCGLASLLAGVIWTGGTAYNLVVGGSIEPPSAFGAVLALAATALMVFAFVGIYAGVGEATSLMGLVGAGLGILGATLLSGVNTLAFARSVGAVQVTRPPLEVGGPGVLALVLGVLLLGVETVRSDAYGRWSGAGFTLAVLLLPMGAFNADLWILAILAASVGFIHLGWQLWRGHQEERPNQRHAAAPSAAG